MNNKKRAISVKFFSFIIALLALGLMAFSLAACNKSANTETKNVKVGISMPTKDVQRWNQDGDYLVEQLKSEGYSTTLQYASNEISTQVSQIESMISAGCKVLVIAPIDGNSLGTVIKQAVDNNIKIIAYDRMIMNSDSVDSYCTFDNSKVGQSQGQYIIDKLNLSNSDASHTLEILSGDLADNNSKTYYDGAMSVLKPYIDSGKLLIKSGQKSLEESATTDWKTEAAQNRMDSIIAANYANGTNLDAVLCANDTIALGVVNSLASNYKGSYPIITGQDCEVTNVKLIKQDKQAMSIFKNIHDLADAASATVNKLVNNEELTYASTTVNNGVKNVPTSLSPITVCEKKNIDEVLINSGYYTADQLS